MASDLLTAARTYAARGWAVIPLHSPVLHDGHWICSCGNPLCSRVGKHPRIKDWRGAATSDPDQIVTWWKKWPHANIGLATGAPSGLLVVDQDGDSLPGTIPHGPVARTGKGYHYYVALPDVPHTNRVDVGQHGFDIRTTGGLIVAPPSRHASGSIYTWETSDDLPLPPAPAWLLDLIALPAVQPVQVMATNGNGSVPAPSNGGNAAYLQRAIAGECEKVLRAAKRNEQLNKSAFALGTLVGGGELSEDEVFAALMDAGLHAGLHAGLPADECRRTIKSGLKAGIARPRTIKPPTTPTRPAQPTPEPQPLTPDDYINADVPALPEKFTLACLNEEEYGDANLFTRMYAGKLVYDHAEKAWYVWGGQSWYRDRCGLVRQLIAGQVARQYLLCAADLTPKAEDDSSMRKLVDKLLGRAMALRKLNRCNNVREFATSMLAITGEEWDRNPWLLGVANGVLDLRSGKLRPGQPDDYIRVASETEWRGLDAPAPRFEQFISEIFDGDAEIAAFAQRLLGYAITGLSIEHVFPVLWGEKGRNGKDTLLETLKRVLGNLADVITTDVLMTPTGRGQAAPHLMDLMGKRLVWASETAAGARLNEAQVKLITGGGTIKTRPLYGAMVEFQPTHLVMLITNFKPKVSAEDEALWSRMVLLPFNLRFVENPNQPDERQRDPHLLNKLATETSGILAWLVRGCLAWQKEGLRIPDKIRASTQEYRDEEDVIGQFIEDRCVIQAHAHVSARDLYQAYRIWAEEGGMQPLNQTNFGKRLVKRFERRRTMTAFEYVGVGLLATTSSPPPRGQGEGKGMAEPSYTQPAIVAAPPLPQADERAQLLRTARALLRVKGTPKELGINLDALSTAKLIEFCRVMEQRPGKE